MYSLVITSLANLKDTQVLALADYETATVGFILEKGRELHAKMPLSGQKKGNMIGLNILGSLKK